MLCVTTVSVMGGLVINAFSIKLLNILIEITSYFYSTMLNTSTWMPLHTWQVNVMPYAGMKLICFWCWAHPPNLSLILVDWSKAHEKCKINYAYREWTVRLWVGKWIAVKIRHFWVYVGNPLWVVVGKYPYPK